MSAVALERALRASGVDCRVEQRDRLAILIPENAALRSVDRWRADAVRLARELGFTNVALELPPD